LDPGSLPRSPLEDPGASPEVDILIGTTREEGTFFVNSPWRPAPDPDSVPDLVRHLTGAEEPSRLIERYRERACERGGADDPIALLVDIATDALVERPVARWAAARAASVESAGGRVYRYRVDHRGAGPIMGATHTVEVPLLFRTWDDGGPGERLGGQGVGTAGVARELVRAWARFVHGDRPGWEAVVPGGATTEVAVFGGAQPLSIEHREPDEIASRV
jgi:para-nitrobenzyl esterase